MSKSSNPAEPKWTAQDSSRLYNIENWSNGYFAISKEGELLVRAPVADNCVEDVSLIEIVNSLQERGLDMPVLLRLENLVDARIREINESFRAAIAAADYKGEYRGAFPVKVNQQSHVISEIVRFGKRYHHGLEVGSKAELLIALSTMEDRESLIICNGYKDQEFIDLGLQARILGFKCFFVIENPSEIQLIIARSKEMGVEPMIGARLKLFTRVEGHWSEDSGDRSLFGLNTNELIQVIDKLKSEKLLHCFQLVHFHLGSQIPNIRNIRQGLLEACRYYVDLCNEGAPLGYLDIGGGLAVDYMGTYSTDGHSRNYNVQEYCADIIEAIQESMDEYDLPHPTIVSESGRATVAHTAVLLFNVLDVTQFQPGPIPDTLPDDTPEPITNLMEVARTIVPSRIQECYNDVIHYRSQVRELFARGEIGLRTVAIADNLYLFALRQIVEQMSTLRRIPPEIESLPDQLADIYYGNFSVFQSLPDSWAIDQVFPVMPIHRLTEEPTHKAVIADITCDCDGKLHHFSHMDENFSHTIPLHTFTDGEEYYIGVFLVGAYQETLGDLHNLFGDTNIASIRVNEDRTFDLVHEFEGDSISDVLTYVEYEPQNLFQTFRRKAERAVKDGRISVAQRQQMIRLFEESLRGYTYFEK
ncbi:MAG: biosynthetic arginine decarboxylase [Deltaproteobacteria bacterium]|nr:biosynthetic arginine decarboxylase [Deltaproteobacteria bacterium]MBN2673612.1 biosynthetic arginine decarboxylase [Deltaproteobacteria bacterium]